MIIYLARDSQYQRAAVCRLNSSTLFAIGMYISPYDSIIRCWSEFTVRGEQYHSAKPARNFSCVILYRLLVYLKSSTLS